LVERVDDPTEQFPVAEDRREEEHVGLVGAPDPRIVREVHVPGFDPRVSAPVLQHPLHLQFGDRREELDVRPLKDDLPFGGQDGRVEVLGEVRDRGAGDVLQGVAVLLVDRVQPVSEHPVGDGIDLRFGVPMERQIGVDIELLPRDVSLPEVLPDVGPLVFAILFCRPARFG
jgi:hypothetical protein